MASDLTAKNAIVVLGGGYCGARVALHLAKKMAQNKIFGNNYHVVVVDKMALHLYAADLYEIATAYYPKITDSCVRELADSISLNFRTLFGKKGSISFVHDEAVAIDYKDKKIKLKQGRKLDYSYLVMALGAVTNFYDIPGIEGNAYPLKTLADGLGLNCYLDQFFKERWQKKDHTSVHIAVAGGGFTGVEIACELPGFLKKSARKYHFKRDEVKITVVQRGPELIGLGPKLSHLTELRLNELGIDFICNTEVLGYKNKQLQIQPKDAMRPTYIPADILIWTAGIKPNPLLKQFPILHESGYLEALPNLEATHYPKVYVGGDNAAVFDVDRHAYLPKLGVLAVQQAKVIANNIYADLVGHSQQEYKPKDLGFIISLGGKYFAYSRGKFLLKGLIPWAMRRIFDLWYFASMLPFKRAFKKWRKTEEIFMRND